MNDILDAPETNVAIFAFLLNLAWEFAQVPLFAGMPMAAHWSAILIYARATLGDVGIALTAFWAVALAVRSRQWIVARQAAGFVSVGIALTIIFEWLATHVLARWAYATAMPIVPVLRIALAPLLQWLVLPPVVIWFVRRQLTGRGNAS
jgi:hypothetical protein